MSLQDELKQLQKEIEGHRNAQTTLSNCITDKCGQIEGIKKQIAEEAKSKLDYDKPIMTYTETGALCLLVSNCNAKSYKVIGYDWLRLVDGKFNSCKLWNTKQEAVGAYSFGGRKPFNSEAFDEIKAMQKNVTEFEVDGTVFKLVGDTLDITNTNGCAARIFLIDEMDAIILGLRQMHATLLRQKVSE